MASPAAPTVVNRKRAVLTNAIGYAVELELLAANPVVSIKWRAPKASHAVDRRSVVNPLQARTLLAAVGAQRRSGPRLVAFFAVMYFAALRPEEAVNLRVANLDLPAEGWGELHLERSSPYAGREWTDNDRQRDDRQLKHRAEGEVRFVPCPPELTRLLRAHLARFGTDSEGGCFTVSVGERWPRSLTPGPGVGPGGWCSPRRCTSRHWRGGHMTCVTLPSRLGSTVAVPAPQVAEWAGHSVAVLLEVYAKCIEGQHEAAKRRVEASTRVAVRQAAPGVDTHWTQMVVVGRCWPVTAGHVFESTAERLPGSAAQNSLVSGVPPAGLEPATHGLGNRRSIL